MCRNSTEKQGKTVSSVTCLLVIMTIVNAVTHNRVVLNSNVFPLSKAKRTEIQIYQLSCNLIITTDWSHKTSFEREKQAEPFIQPQYMKRVHKNI